MPAFGEPLDRFPAFTASVCNLNPESRGRVRLRSRNADDAPLIEPCYLSTDGDRPRGGGVAAPARGASCRCLRWPDTRRASSSPARQYAYDDDLSRLAGDIGTTIFHPVGTCRMGRADERDAVLDSRLRLRGIAGLWVADASAMPTITSGNTNAPTLMLAERAARWIAEATP